MPIPRRWDDGEYEDDPFDPGPTEEEFPTGVINPTPAPAPVPTGGGGGGAGGGYVPFAGLTDRPSFNFPDAPIFKYPKFKAPSQAEAEKEPGYQFRLNSGQQALERSAAAKGILRTGGTLKDFVEYGQNFGAAEYNNVFNRALQGYDREYRGAYDAFGAKLNEYNNLFKAELASGMGGFERDWQQYVFDNTPRGGGSSGPYDPEPQSPDVSGQPAGGYTNFSGGSDEDDEWNRYEYAA